MVSSRVIADREGVGIEQERETDREMKRVGGWVGKCEYACACTSSACCMCVACARGESNTNNFNKNVW